MGQEMGTAQRKHNSAWAIELLAIIGMAVFSALLVTLAGILKWWESAIIAGVVATLIIALLWTIDEIKWLNPR
jgi:predicted cation transporter